MFYLFDDGGRETHSTPVVSEDKLGKLVPSFHQVCLGNWTQVHRFGRGTFISWAIFQAHFSFFWGSRDISQWLSTAWNYVLDQEHWKPLLELMQRTFTYYGICCDSLMQVYSVKLSNRVNSYFHFFTCW